LVALAGGVLLALGLGHGTATAQDAQTQSEQGVRGTLTVDGEPVAGVVVNVFTDDGRPVGSAESGPDGTWFVAVPGAGDYRVELDVSTLPSGVVPARGNVREPSVP